MLRFKQLTLLLGDLLALNLGLFIAAATRSWHLPPTNWLDLLVAFALLFFIAIILMFIIGLYDVDRAKNNRAFFQKIIFSALIWLILGIIFFYISPAAKLSPKTILVLTALLGYTIIALWRFCYNRFLSAKILQTKIIFVGLTSEVAELINLFKAEPERGFVMLGCIVENSQATSLPLVEISKTPVVSSIAELIKTQPGIAPELVIIAPGAGSELLHQELYRLLFNQVSVLELATFYEQIQKRLPPFTFSESWFVTHLTEQHKKMYDRARIIFDYTIAIIMALFFFLTFPIIGLILKFSSKGPVLFKQTRLGRNGIPFIMYKYRTMRVLAADGSAETAGPQFASHGDDRVTKFGKFLRRTRLDELPQCLNILRGEMGLIGPRPERPEFVATLTAQMPFYSLRHLVKPGLTGWAQLQQAYYGDIAENLKKLEYDLYYIKNRGAWLDLAIILRTFNVIFRMIGR